MLNEATPSQTPKGNAGRDEPVANISQHSFENALRRLSAAVKQERDILAKEHKTTSERLEHLIWLHDRLKEGDSRPMIRELTARCEELARTLNAKNAESRKSELLDRLTIIDEITRENS